MRRLVLAFAVLAVCVPVGLAASASSPAGFAYGVAAGEITSKSAVLWTRAPKPGPVTLWIGQGPPVMGDVIQRYVLSTPRATRVAGLSSDQTVSFRVVDLKPGTRYVYAFRQGTLRSQAGLFETAHRHEPTAAVRLRGSPARPGTERTTG